MTKDQLQDKRDPQEFNAYGKLLNYSTFLSFLWLLSAYFLFPWLFAIYPVAPFFLGLESSREAHHLSRPKEMEHWQKNLVFVTAGTAITLALLFVTAGAVPTLAPFIPFFLIGLIAVNTLHLASVWAKTLYNYFSTDKAERTPRMKLELAKSSVGLFFQAGALAAIACTVLLATPFVQIVAAAAMAGAILLLIGARLFTSYKMAQIQKEELLNFHKKEADTKAPAPMPTNRPTQGLRLRRVQKSIPNQIVETPTATRSARVGIRREIDLGPPLVSKELHIPELLSLQEDEGEQENATKPKRHSEPGPLSGNRYQFNQNMARKESLSAPPELHYNHSSDLL